jgi:hypothetical protein
VTGPMPLVPPVVITIWPVSSGMPARVKAAMMAFLLRVPLRPHCYQAAVGRGEHASHDRGDLLGTNVVNDYYDVNDNILVVGCEA